LKILTSSRLLRVLIELRPDLQVTFRLA